MSTIHFLNVNNGACSIIQHNSGNITVVDVCNATKLSVITEDSVGTESVYKTFAVKGNFHQKEHPENPIAYLRNIVKADCIFRYVQTHPDMDHMDGIKALFETFDVYNFWDTENNKVIDKASDMGPYNRDDWDYYQNVRKNSTHPKVLHLYSDARGQYYNKNDDGTSGGDGIYILSPTEELVNQANESGEYNELSYALLYRTGKYKIIFAGDTEESAWNQILKNHKSDISNVDLLIAPHHGRKSGGNDNYLNVLQPKLTLFGNAGSQHLDYSSWNNRNLLHITNNQAGNIVIDFSDGNMDVYCSNVKYAKADNDDTFYNSDFDAYFLMRI